MSFLRSLGTFLFATSFGAAVAQDQAPGQPPLTKSIAGSPNWPMPKSPQDVDTVPHLLNSLYDVISGPAGKPRDWDRFRSLFLPNGRLGVVTPDVAPTSTTPARLGDAILLTPEIYVQRDDPYFKTHGFFEHAITNRIEEFGNLSQVWSTYESRNAATDPHPFARGANSLQIIRARGRYWIASILWDEERPGLTLPKKYLR